MPNKEWGIPGWNGPKNHLEGIQPVMESELVMEGKSKMADGSAAHPGRKAAPVGTWLLGRLKPSAPPAVATL
jgi:hypothetical protein